MDSSSDSRQRQALKPLGSLGRDEMNLAEFPIALLTDRVPKDQTVAIYQDEIFDERIGRTLARKLTISTGNEALGLTTAVDDEIILAFIQLTRIKNNFTQRKVEFSRHELIQLLGWARTGASYDRIEKSLDRWTSVYLKYENAWRDNRTKTWKSIGFHIIDKYEINDSRTLDDQLDLIPSFIIWGEDIFESFQAGYLKPLDYDLCMGLSNSTAKRMYRFLDKRFHHKPDWAFELKEFAHRDIGLSPCYEGPAHLKRNLKPALSELEKVGFLEPLTDGERFFKEGKAWKVRVIQKIPALTVVPLKSDQATPPPLPLAAELVSRGVSSKSAAELVAEFPAAFVAGKIEAFDWEMKQAKPPKRPAGFLVKSIRDGYATDPNFVSKVEQTRRDEVKRQTDATARESRRSKLAADTRERKIADQVAAYRKSRTSEELAQLEADAIAQASEAVRSGLNAPHMRPFRDTQVSLLIRDHIAALIQTGQLETESV